MTRFESLKKVFIKVLIGSLIAAAVVAVLAVLIGQLNDILWRSLATLSLVALHALASLFYIRTSEQSHEIEDLTFFSNSVFLIIILSFVTSIFGTWKLFDGELVGKLYETYFVLLFASLHGELLYKSTKFEAYIDNLVKINYGFMAIVICMLLPIIFLGDTAFGDFYYRALAAAAIVDATLSILVVIFHKLYLQKHPQAPSQLFAVTATSPTDPAAPADPGMNAGQPAPTVTAVAVKRHTNPLLILFGIYIAGQIVISLLWMVIGHFGTPGY